MNPSRPDSPDASWREQTLVLHGDAGCGHGADVVSPIHYSATFRAETAEQFSEMATTVRPATFYTRHGNPVNKRVEAILAGLEGTESALLTGSGMGAICTTILALLKAGDHVVAQHRKSSPATACRSASSTRRTRTACAPRCARTRS